MAQSARPKPATVLIVENEALVRLELAYRLTEMGMVVLAASDADEAIALLDARPDIVLMVTDIRMPGSSDGLRLAHHVRERWPPVKIIVTSGLIGTDLSELPCDSVFLPKPYAPDGLLEALAHVADGGGPGIAGRQVRIPA